MVLEGDATFGVLFYITPKKKKMKKITILLLSCLFLGLSACTSCKSEETPQPDPSGNNNPPPPGSDLHITTADLLAHYLIIELSSGDLRVDYFYMDGTTLKGWRDGLNMRRGMESLSLNNDTLKYTISGTNEYTYVLKKGTSGKLSVISIQTSTEGVVAHCEVQTVADAAPFVSTGSEHIFKFINSNGDNVYLYFSFMGVGNVWRYDGNNGSSDYMAYYMLQENLGWKSNDEQTFGVAVSSWKGNNVIDMLLQSTVPQLGPDIQAASAY